MSGMEQLVAFIHECEVRGFWWQINGPGSYTDEGLGPHGDGVEIVASPLGDMFDPVGGGFIANGSSLPIAARRARRALEKAGAV